MRIPLVGVDADVYADRFHSQGTRHINDAVVRFRICNRFRALHDLSILRRCRTAAGICLASFKAYAGNRIATQSTGNRIVSFVLKAAVDCCAVVCLRFVVGDDDQFLLIIDVDLQIAFIAGNLVGSLRCHRRSIQIGVMVNVAVRCFVLHGERVSLFDKRHVRIMDALSIHIKIVYRNLYRRVGNILEGDNVVLKCKLQFLCGLRRFIVLTEDV